MKKFINVFLVLFLVCSFAPKSGAENIKFPGASGYVNDYAGVLSNNVKAQLSALSREIKTKTGAELVVVTIDTTRPLTIEQYAVELFQKWGIGEKGKDNGVLLLLAIKDRKVRIEVGYGLEGVITDLESKLIIDQFMTPAFKKGLYDQGVVSGVVMLAKSIQKEYGVNITIGSRQLSDIRPVGRRKKSPLGSVITLIFFMLIFGVRFGSLFFLMSGGGGYWSSGSRGSYGGGFGGFGGGMSGGGGASGGW